MEVTCDVAVVGGGPAGCAAAITSARAGLRTILFERGRYPRHKVCGEFISPEAHEILIKLLGEHISLFRAQATITHARMISDGQHIQFALPRPAWSITRYDLDQALWCAAQAAGVECHEGTTVERVEDGIHGADGTRARAKTVINAAGRWSNLRRAAPPSGPHWIGLKAHYSGENARPCTDVYFFRGGYCGVQPIGPNSLNVSAMVRSDVAIALDQVFAASPELWLRSRAWEPITPQVSTSPLIHAAPEPVSNGAMNVGDAAGFVDPFIGDGISLALRSGVLAAECEGNAKCYEVEYDRRFASVFRTAAAARRLVYAPEIFRRVAILAFRSGSLRSWALNRTRAGK